MVPLERTATTLTDRDLEAIKIAVHGDIDPAIHKEHHDLLAMWIKREYDKQVKWEKARNNVIGSVVVGITTGIGAAIYTFGEDAVKFLKEHWK